MLGRKETYIGSENASSRGGLVVDSSVVFRQYVTPFLCLDSKPTILAISDLARYYLHNNNSQNIGDSDAENYRRVVHFRSQNKPLEEAVWKAKLPVSKKKWLEQFLNKPQYALALNKLLPITGLWKGFSLGHFNRLNALRCEDEILCYLTRIRRVWHYILDGNTTAMNATDTSTIEHLQGWCPGISGSDAELIKKLMECGTIFSSVPSPS